MRGGERQGSDIVMQMKKLLQRQHQGNPGNPVATKLARGSCGTRLTESVWRLEQVLSQNGLSQNGLSQNGYGAWPFKEQLSQIKVRDPHDLTGPNVGLPALEHLPERCKLQSLEGPRISIFPMN